jgi:PAS domain S-box-containing protein
MDHILDFKSLIENSSILFYAATFDGRILYLNDFGQKLLGLNKDEIDSVINAVSYYINPEERKDLLTLLKADNSISDNEIRMISRDGEYITGHESAFCRKEDSGEKIIYGIINDVSEFVNLNLNSAKLNLELADANQKLKDAYNTMAQQEKMAAIGELAAGVAHEINNPLGFIKSNTRSMTKYLEMLTSVFFEISKEPDLSKIENIGKMDFVLSDLKDILKENEDGLNRIATITESLKRFSRMGDENVQSDFDLNMAIMDTLNIAKGQYKFIAEIKLDLGEIPLVSCNGDSINQVLLNLIVNAANAIESLGSKEKGEILIETSIQDDFIKLSVTDSGPGVDPAIKNKIFDPFFTTKEVGKGTGLGLSLCYDIIVQKHQGRIWVENCDKGGAQFTFTIPMCKV